MYCLRNPGFQYLEVIIIELEGFHIHLISVLYAHEVLEICEMHVLM